MMVQRCSRTPVRAPENVNEKRAKDAQHQYAHKWKENEGGSPRMESCHEWPPWKLGDHQERKERDCQGIESNHTYISSLPHIQRHTGTLRGQQCAESENNGNIVDVRANDDAYADIN